MPSRLALLLAVILLACGCTGGQAPSRPARRGAEPVTFRGPGTVAVTPDAKGIGFSVPVFPMLSHREQIAWLADFKALGISWIRINITWAIVQPTRTSSYNWSRYNAAVAEADAYGIHVDAQADFSAPWARSPGCAPTQTLCQPASPTLYARYAAAIARHFGDGISAEEIWNEPNSVRFWHPRPNPGFYVRMLKAAYVAIKAVDPRLIVVSGGLAPEMDNGTDISALTFAEDMYRDGAKGFFNAFGYHPYSFPYLPDQYRPWSAWSQMAQTRPSIRSIMTAHGDAATPIWITEVGAPTGGPGAAAGCGPRVRFAASERHDSQCLQAAEITQVVQNEESADWLGPAFIYSFQDLGTDEGNLHDFFGLRTAYGTDKSSYFALKRALAARSR